MRLGNNLQLANGTRVTDGSVFPTSPTPVAGDTHWHTTRLRWYGYDGTRWLSDVFGEPFHSYTGSVQPFTGTIDPYITGGPPTYDLWLVEWRPAIFVSGTNNASNYWTISLLQETSTGALNTLVSFNTSAMGTFGSANLRPANMTSFATNPLPSSTTTDIIVRATKTGTAGSLYLNHILMVREVG